MNSSAGKDFPRAILHVDGDSFFASCEIARRPWLKDKPVVTGLERGIATAMNYVAKARGISRAMRLSEIRRTCPDVVIISSDYEAYRLYSRRMYEIVRQYSDTVEEYSVDECFADLTGREARLKISYADMAVAIKRDLESSLGLSFSVGLSVNKVMAKLSSSSHKPSGCIVTPVSEVNGLLAQIEIGKVWGIGSSTMIAMHKKGIVTALDLAHKNKEWVKEHFALPIIEIHEELNGAFVMPLSSGEEDPHSIQRTQTFKPPSSDPAVVFSELSQNVENAAHRLRKLGLFAGRASFFLKTQEFSYSGTEIKLLQSISTPEEILRPISERFNAIFRPGVLYRATGVRLSDLRPAETRSTDLFGYSAPISRIEKLYGAVDRLSIKFGERTLFLGSSLKAIRSEKREKSHHKFGLPFLGEVR